MQCELVPEEGAAVVEWIDPDYHNSHGSCEVNKAGYAILAVEKKKEKERRKKERKKKKRKKRKKKDVSNSATWSLAHLAAPSPKLPQPPKALKP